MPRKPASVRMGEKLDLGHLAEPFSRTSATSNSTMLDAGCEDLTDIQVETFDVERLRKKIIVLAMQRIYMMLLSPVVSLGDKAKLGLAAMAQWEGTKRIIEWDKRKVDEKVLADDAERLAKQILKFKGKISDEKFADLQIKAAESIIGIKPDDSN